jgi:hypothetical protein
MMKNTITHHHGKMSTTIKQYFLARDTFEKTKIQRYYEYLEAERVRLEAERIIREQNNFS